MSINTYAKIVNNTIVGQLWLISSPTPSTPSGYTDITNQPGSPKDGATWDGTAWIAPAPTVAANVAALSAQGFTITSNANPAISGTYSLASTTQAAINGIATFILTNPGKFPNGSATFPFLDMAGNAHVFPDTTVFQQFASAYAAAVTNLMLYADGQAPLPKMTATI